jgi:hypothetical protein
MFAVQTLTVVLQGALPRNSTDNEAFGGAVQFWADLARGRWLTAVREAVVAAIQRGSGPGEGA